MKHTRRMAEYFENQELLEVVRDSLPSFLESDLEEHLVKGDTDLTDFVLVRPNSSSYRKRLAEKVMMFPIEHEGRLAFYFPVAPEA